MGYYCEDCDKGCGEREKHYCQSVCSECHFGNDQCVPGPRKFCSDCRRSFRSEFCFRNHQSKDVCRYHFRCKYCQEYVNLLRHKKDVHVCGEVFCKTCQEYVEPNVHQCYWKKLDPKVWYGRISFICQVCSNIEFFFPFRKSTSIQSTFSSTLKPGSIRRRD